MESRTLRCPSCGGVLPVAGIACPACGFTVWRAGDGWDDQVFRASMPAVAVNGGGVIDAAGVVVDAAVDEAADLVSEGWAASPPSPPPRPRSLSAITPPSPVDLPPSQVSVDGLDIHWSNRFSLRAGWGASSPAGSLPAVAPAGHGVPRGGSRTGVPVSSGWQDHAAVARSAGAPSKPAPGKRASSSAVAASAPAATRSRAGSWPVNDDAAQVAAAAARGRQRRGEISSAAGLAAPTVASPPAAAFDQVLSSDFRGAATISGGQPVASRPPAGPSRWAPSGISAVDFPGWFRGISNPVASYAGRANRGRAPLPRAGVWLAVIALLFVGLLVFTAYAQRWSTRQGEVNAGASSETVTIAPPRSADLADVRRELAGLAVVAGTPSAQIPASRPAAARHARTLRTRLILWRDRFELTSHQWRVLDHAIVYAGALAHWLKTPGSEARRAAALKAWLTWRADDPGLAAT